MGVLQERIERIKKIYIGNHAEPAEDGGDPVGCALELRAWVRAEKWSDHPSDLPTEIGQLVRSLNDREPDDERRTRRMLATLTLEAGPDTKETRTRRAWMIVDWDVRERMPRLLRALDLGDAAAELAALPEIVDQATFAPALEACTKIGEACRAIRKAARAARAALGALDARAALGALDALAELGALDALAALAELDALAARAALGALDALGARDALGALDARAARDAFDALAARAALDALAARDALGALAARAALGALDARAALGARDAFDARDALGALDARAARDAFDALAALAARAADDRTKAIWSKILDASKSGGYYAARTFARGLPQEDFDLVAKLFYPRRAQWVALAAAVNDSCLALVVRLCEVGK